MTRLSLTAAALTVALAASAPAALAGGVGAPSHTIRVATFVPNPPDTVVSRGGRISGFDPQLVEAAARTQGLRVAWVRIRPFSRLLTTVASGGVDMGASAITITSARRRTLLFGTPNMATDQAILTRATSTVASLADLSGKRVGGVPATTAQATIQGIPGAVFVPLSGPEAVDAAVAAGAVDAGIGDSSAASWAAINNRSLKVAAILDTGQVAAWTFPRTAAGNRLRITMNRGLAAVRANGTYRTILRRWGVAAP